MRKSALAVLFTAVLACEASPASAAEGETPAPFEAARASRVQFNMTGGLMMPSQFTPNIVFPTFTGPGPYVRAETTLAVLSHLELGGYLSFSDHPLTSINTLQGPSSDVLGSVLLASGGALIKLRLDPAPWATVRFGATVGANYIAFPLQRSGGQPQNMNGEGLQVGFDADVRLRLADHLALVAEVGFLAQPIGSATFPDGSDYAGTNVSFSFPPTMFAGAGPELMF